METRIETDTHEQEAPASCPLCGAPAPEAGAECPACGVPRADAAPAETQPRWEIEDAGGPGREVLLDGWRRACRLVALAGETALEIGLRPRPAFERFRFRGGLGWPTAFALLLGGPSLLVGVACDALLLEAGRPLRAGEALVWLLVAPPLYVYIRAQCLHLALVLSGSARESFAVTYRVAGYSNGAVAPLLILPLAGAFLFLVAGTLVEATGLRRAHGLSPLRAALLEAAPAAALLIGLFAAHAARWVGWSQLSP